jgi:hypothetical protein
VECLQNRDIRFDDTLPEAFEKEAGKEEEVVEISLVENVSGGETV